MKKLILAAALFVSCLTTAQAQIALTFSTDSINAVKTSKTTILRFADVSKITVEITLYNIEEKYRSLVMNQITKNLVIDNVLTPPTEGANKVYFVKNSEQVAVDYKVQTVVFLPKKYAAN
jgi:hypothetical protein